MILQCVFGIHSKGIIMVLIKFFNMFSQNMNFEYYGYPQVHIDIFKIFILFIFRNCFWTYFVYLWITFCIWWLKIFVLGCTIQVKHHNCILRLNEVCFTHTVGDKSYHMQKCMHTCHLIPKVNFGASE